MFNIYYTRVLALGKSVALAVMCFNFITDSFVSAEEVCKFGYTGQPENLNNQTISVPHEIVAMSEYVHVGTPIFISEQVVYTPSIFFIIDNSTSMSGNGMGGMDVWGNRFKVTRDLIDTLKIKFPGVEVGIAAFRTYLFFDPTDSDYFVQCPQQNTGAYLPLFKLNSKFPPDNKFGWDILQGFLEIDTVDNDHVELKYVPSNIFDNMSGTNINSGFDAAKHAFLSSKYPKECHYIIFLSDGEANQPMMGDPDAYVAGTDVPTTFTVYFSSNGTAPQSIQDMTENIKTNGYSSSNPGSNLWAFENTEYEVLMKFLMDNVISVITQEQISYPVDVSINGIDPVGDWDSTGYIFSELFPLTGDTTEFVIDIDYHVFMDSITDAGDTIVNEKDTSSHVEFDVAFDKNAVLSDDYVVECWDRTLVFYYNGNQVSSVDETMEELEIRFTEKEVDVLYGYEDVSVEITHTEGNDRDKETLKLSYKDTYFTGTFLRKIAGPNKGDGILQHKEKDNIVAVFRNKKLILDTLRIAIPFALSGTVTLTKGIYFDNTADGFVDSISIELYGTKIKDNIDELVEIITLPEHRKFTVQDYSYISEGIALNVSEGADKPQTYVTDKDILEISDTLLLKNGGYLLPTSNPIRIIDSIAPIIMSASLIDSVVIINNGQQDSLTELGRDELTVIFSENVEKITKEKPFIYYSNDAQKTFEAKLKVLSQKDNQGVFHVRELYGVESVKNGDSIRIQWALSDNVYDANKNYQENPENIRRPIDVTTLTVIQKGPYELELQGTLFDPDIALTLPDEFLNNNEIKEMLLNFKINNDGEHEGIMVITLTPNNTDNVPDNECYSGLITIYDAVGNEVIVQQEMAYLNNSKNLVYLWDGRNKNDRRVGPGAYLALVVITWYPDGFDNDSGKKDIQRLIIGVRE